MGVTAMKCYILHLVRQNVVDPKKEHLYRCLLNNKTESINHDSSLYLLRYEGKNSNVNISLATMLLLHSPGILANSPLIIHTPKLYLPPLSIIPAPIPPSIALAPLSPLWLIIVGLWPIITMICTGLLHVVQYSVVNLTLLDSLVLRHFRPLPFLDKTVIYSHFRLKKVFIAMLNCNFFFRSSNIS